MRRLHSARALSAAIAALAPLLASALASAQPAPPKKPAAPPASSAAPAPRPPPDLPPPPPPPWQPGAAPAAAEPPAAPEPLPSNAGAPPAPSAPTVDAAQTAALERRVALLEQRLAETRREMDARERARVSHEDADKMEWLRRFRVSGYVQPQLVWQWYDANASPNPAVVGPNASIGANAVVAKADGTTTNPDFFRLRRARLTTEFSPNEHTRVVFEIDPTPPDPQSIAGQAAGPTTIARTVEAVGIVHWPLGAVTEFAMGIFKVPFGYELLQSDADRPFIERSWVEQNLFPGDFDTGARAYTDLFDRRISLQLAVVNGQTQGERTFALLPDLNHGKDLVGRVAYDFGAVTLGGSGYYGQGQVVDAELLRFKQFPRWAVNGEIDVHYTLLPGIGQTRLYAEITRAQNLDRGTKYGALALPSFPSDLANGSVNDLDELGYWVRLEQDVGRRLTLGARYDSYSPNSAEGNDGRDTFAGVAVVHFTKELKYMLEFDYATDNVHAPGTAAPSRHITSLSNVLQARF